MFDVAQPCGVIVRSCCLVEACRGVFGGARRPLSSRLHERLAAAREHKETCPLGRGPVGTDTVGTASRDSDDRGASGRRGGTTQL